MIDFKEGTRQMDRPDILSRLFFPRREFCKDSETPKAINHMIKAEDNVSIGCARCTCNYTINCFIRNNGNSNW